MLPEEKEPLKLTSNQDLSVNFVFPGGQEARFVRRTDEYFICYLSSHNGCNQACRFCHLTQTGQTEFVEASASEMLAQARKVLAHYAGEIAAARQAPASRIHFNWMARGEPLASSVITGHWLEITDGLRALAQEVGVGEVRFNISSIFPAKGTRPDVLNAFHEGPSPTLFYSLYSLNPDFRKRWIPKAEDPAPVFAQLAAWQRRTGGELVLHWAMIEGQNDDQQTIADIAQAVQAHGLVARFNLVRYNPHGQGQGQEPEESTLNARFDELSRVMRAEGSRIVPRVGFDVKASCGMFVLSQG